MYFVCSFLHWLLFCIFWILSFVFLVFLFLCDFICFCYMYVIQLLLQEFRCISSIEKKHDLSLENRIVTLLPIVVWIWGVPQNSCVTAAMFRGEMIWLRELWHNQWMTPFDELIMGIYYWAVAIGRWLEEAGQQGACSWDYPLSLSLTRFLSASGLSRSEQLPSATPFCHDFLQQWTWLTTS